jgi:hypothetical protein
VPTVYHLILMLHQGHRGPPFLPAARALARIELGAHEAYHHILFCHIFLYKYLSLILVLIERITPRKISTNPYMKSFIQ